jgi:type VI secretion system protein ImpA
VGGTRAAGLETRQEALVTLLRVAEYFRQAEPHSPISYALEQAVRWARLSLPELLSELVTDKSAREEIFKRAGIKQPDADK